MKSDNFNTGAFEFCAFDKDKTMVIAVNFDDINTECLSVEEIEDLVRFLQSQLTKVKQSTDNTLEECLAELEECSDELTEFGDSHEKSRGYGMMEVIEAVRTATKG